MSGKRWHGRRKFLVYQHDSRRCDVRRARAAKRSPGQTRPLDPATRTRLLGDAIVLDHIGVQPLLTVLYVIACHDLGFPLVNKDVWRVLQQGFLHRLVQIEAFHQVWLRHRGEDGFIQLKDLPAAEPSHGAGLTIVPDKGAGVGMRIKVVRDP